MKEKVFSIVQKIATVVILIVIMFSLSVLATEAVNQYILPALTNMAKSNESIEEVDIEENVETSSNIDLENNIVAEPQVASGDSSHTILKSDGTVWAWGDNTHGQLGDGTTTASKEPVRVITEDGTPLEDVVQISAAYWQAVAVKSDGTVWAWGYIYYGTDVGGISTTTLVATQVLDAEGEILTDVVKVKAGVYHTLALKEDGTVWSWGINSTYELGRDRGKSITAAGRVGKSIMLNDIIDISVGCSQSFAIKRDGTVYGWGYNGYGQLGTGDTANRTEPTVLSGFTNVAKISGGYYNTAVLKKDGTVWEVGMGTSGQLGDGANATKHTLTQVKISDSQYLINVKDIAVNSDTTHAVLNDGTVYGWGYNNCGQVGNGTNVNAIYATPVTMEYGEKLNKKVYSIAEGISYKSHTELVPMTVIFILEDGNLVGAGYGGSNKLLNETSENRNVFGEMKPSSLIISDMNSYIKVRRKQTIRINNKGRG